MGLPPEWSLRVEYLHLQFNGVGENFGFAGTIIGVPIVSNVQGTVRGRFGYAFNNVLLYGTGGWAYGGSATQRALSRVWGRDVR
jgi:outer membrane immunogenic protein